MVPEAGTIPVIGVPLDGLLLMSLAPQDVPTSALVSLVKVGVKEMVAAASGVVVEAPRLAVAAATTVTVAVSVAVSPARLVTVSV